MAKSAKKNELFIALNEDLDMNVDGDGDVRDTVPWYYSSQVAAEKAGSIHAERTNDEESVGDIFIYKLVAVSKIQKAKAVVVKL